MTDQVNLPSNPDSDQNSSGFSFGVAMGTLLGVASMYLFGTRSGRKLKKEIYEDIKTEIDRFKKTHPRETKQIRDIFEAAFDEARATGDEIKQVAERARERARREAEKRRFIQSGRPLKRNNAP